MQHLLTRQEAQQRLHRVRRARVGELARKQRAVGAQQRGLRPAQHKEGLFRDCVKPQEGLMGVSWG